jgi:hypothetical protein
MDLQAKQLPKLRAMAMLLHLQHLKQQVNGWVLELPLSQLFSILSVW